MRQKEQARHKQYGQGKRRGELILLGALEKTYSDNLKGGQGLRRNQIYLSKVSNKLRVRKKYSIEEKFNAVKRKMWLTQPDTRWTIFIPVLEDTRAVGGAGRGRKLRQ